MFEIVFYANSTKIDDLKEALNLLALLYSGTRIDLRTTKICFYCQRERLPSIIETMAIYGVANDILAILDLGDSHG